MCVVVHSALGGWRSVALGEGGLGVEGGGGRFPLSRTHLESVSRNVFFFGRQKIGLFYEALQLLGETPVSYGEP